MGWSVCGFFFCPHTSSVLHLWGGSHNCNFQLHALASTGNVTPLPKYIYIAWAVTVHCVHVWGTRARDVQSWVVLVPHMCNYYDCHAPQGWATFVCPCKGQCRGHRCMFSIFFFWGKLNINVHSWANTKTPRQSRYSRAVAAQPCVCPRHASRGPSAVCVSLQLKSLLHTVANFY